MPFPEPCFLNVQQSQVSKRIGNPQGTLEVHTSLVSISHPHLPPSLVSLRKQHGLTPSNFKPPTPSQRGKSFSLTPSFQSPQVLSSWCFERIAVKMPGSQYSWKENRQSSSEREGLCVLAPATLHLPEPVSRQDLTSGGDRKRKTSGLSMSQWTWLTYPVSCELCSPKLSTPVRFQAFPLSREAGKVIRAHCGGRATDSAEQWVVPLCLKPHLSLLLL